MPEVTSGLATLTPSGWKVKEKSEGGAYGGFAASSLTDSDVDAIQYGFETLPGNAYAERRLQRAAQLRNAKQFPGPTLVFDFNEATGSTIYDKMSQRPAVLNAGSVAWTSSRGVLFNGSGAFQFAANTMDHQAGQICDLSTLVPGDEITVAMIFNHSATLSGQQPLFYYGCSGENTCGGWGLVARTNGKVFFYHRAVGSSAEFSMALSNRDPGNAAANNTLTAIALGIRINPVNPEYFEIAYADRPLEATAEINSIGFSNNAYMALKGDGTGTGPAKYSTLGPLTIGGKPNATYTSLAQIAGSSSAYVGLRFLAIQRYKQVPGRFHSILQDMAADRASLPLSLFMEA